jgi:hypothetical protein
MESVGLVELGGVVYEKFSLSPSDIEQTRGLYELGKCQLCQLGGNYWNCLPASTLRRVRHCGGNLNEGAL